MKMDLFEGKKKYDVYMECSNERVPVRCSVYAKDKNDAIAITLNRIKTQHDFIAPKHGVCKPVDVKEKIN